MFMLPVLAGLLTGPASVPHPTAARVTTKYRIESSNETVVDLSGFGQPNQQTSLTLVTWVAVTVGDSAGGRAVHMVIDSMRIEGEVPGLSQASADSTKEGFVHGFLDRSGRLTNLSQKPEDSALLSEFRSVLYTLFPRMKVDAKAGESWADSLEIPTVTGVANLVSTLRISFSAGAPESIGGVAGLRVNASTSSKVTGTMENPMAGTMEVEGLSSGTRSFVMAPDGRFLGGTTTSTIDQIVKVAMAPNPIPVRVQQKLKVDWLR